MNAQTHGLHQVFIARSQLHQRWQKQDSFAILASDFGDGLAFLSIWHAWQQDPQRSQRLHYLAFSDLQMPVLQTIQPELQPLFEELSAHWPQAINGQHRLYLQRGQVMLTLIFGAISDTLPEVTGSIDGFYLNHNESNPADWALPQLKQLWRLCKANSTLLSNLATVEHRANLQAAGFAVEPTSPTEPSSLTQQLFAHCQRAPKSNAATRKTKQAIIIGAGMAGCAAAASLASRDWQITLIDAQAEIANQASGNHIGLCHPVFSLDDNFQARLSRAGFFVTQQKLKALLDAQQSVHFASDGHFQMAKDAAAAQLMQLILSEQAIPNTLVTWLNAADCQQKLSIDCEFGGYWFPQGIWINPPSLCHGYINAKTENIVLQLNTHIQTIKFTDQIWHLYDADLNLIAQTETLILANATDAQRLLPDTALPLSASLRSVTRVPAEQLNTTRHSLSGLTYLTAAFAGWRCAGASLVSKTDAGRVEQNNLNDLAKLIGSNAIKSTQQAQTRLCFRPNSSDRLPLVGAVPDTRDIRHSVHQLFHIPRISGLYTLLGFGSRGLTWHALAAEVLACQLNGEPQGIERDLLGAIDPARFALRQLRKKTSLSQQ